MTDSNQAMKKTKSKNDSDFMIKEYDRIHDLWMEENKQTEQRVNFFLGITTGAGGVITIFFQSAPLPQAEILIVSECILSFLLLFGFLTLNRLVIKNSQIEIFRRAMREIQNYFSKDSSEIENYLLKVNKFYGGEKKPFRFYYYLFSGSLMSMMIFVNSLLCGGIAVTALILANQSTEKIILWSVLVIILSSIGFRYYANKIKPVMRPWHYH